MNLRFIRSNSLKPKRVTCGRNAENVRDFPKAHPNTGVTSALRVRDLPPVKKHILGLRSCAFGNSLQELWVIRPSSSFSSPSLQHHGESLAFLKRRLNPFPSGRNFLFHSPVFVMYWEILETFGEFGKCSYGLLFLDKPIWRKVLLLAHWPIFSCSGHFFHTRLYGDFIFPPPCYSALLNLIGIMLIFLRITRHFFSPNLHVMWLKNEELTSK